MCDSLVWQTDRQTDRYCHNNCRASPYTFRGQKTSRLDTDIILLESVQRRLTKRIPGLATMTYYSRLKKLNLESLELRRLRADLTLVYKILFGVIHTKSDRLFSLRDQPQLRGHNYTLNKPRCYSQTRQRFFNIRVINLWNSLPADSTDFSSLHKFCASVGSGYLVSFCTANFT